MVAKIGVTGEVERSHRSPQKDKKSMIASLACLKSSIKLDPSQSMLKLSKKRNATHRAVSRAVNKDPSAEILR